jgi:hypothetical protein
MGGQIVTDVLAGALDFKAALHADQVTAGLIRHRTAAAGKAGGEATIRRLLVAKARARRGVAEELKRVKADIRDVAVSDNALVAFVAEPDVTERDVVAGARGLVEKRVVDSVIRDGHALTRRVRRLVEASVPSADPPNRAVALSMARELRGGLDALEASLARAKAPC